MNTIRTIQPYWDERVQTWVFDDPAAGLVREPFISGIPAMIDFVTANIEDARSGFQLLFSDEPFPGYQFELHRINRTYGGWNYRVINPPMVGWLCPAMFRYFEAAPATIYIAAGELTSDQRGRMSFNQERREDILRNFVQRVADGEVSQGMLRSFARDTLEKANEQREVCPLPPS